MEDSFSSNNSFRKTNCITEKIDHPEKFANALFSHSMQGEDFLCPRECAPFTHVVLTYLKLEKSERKMLKVSQFFPSLELAQKYVDNLKSHTGGLFDQFILPTGRFFGWGPDLATESETKRIIKEAAELHNKARSDFLERKKKAKDDDEKYMKKR